MANANLTQPAMPEGVDPDPNKPISETEEPDEDKLLKDIEKHFKGQVEAAERLVKDRKGDWKRNIELRQGKPSGSYGSYVDDAQDGNQSEYNPDWFLTKSKMAALFSQVPAVQVMHAFSKYQAATGPLAKAINYELGIKRTNAGSAMTEIMADIVNAAGIGAIEVGYAARFEEKEVPAVDTKMLDPKMVQQMIASKQLPMKTVSLPVDYHFFFDRLSPTDLLTPKSFTGSDFNKAPWIGRKFASSWAEVKNEYKLADEKKEQVAKGDEKTAEDQLQTQQGSDNQETNLKGVKGKRIYYWRYRVDPDCKCFTEIWEIVWIEGLDEPVRHEPWNGQQKLPTGKYIGACRFPIQVGTTTYISDNPMVPSDSAASRPQVNDLRRSRSQMFQNRAFSLPFRWFNTDRTDPSMWDVLMRGQIQGAIPVQGDGSKIMGEVARASYPAEDLTFDKMGMQDLYTMWMLGPNQMGQIAPHETTAGEAKLAQGGFSSVMGYERGRIAEFFLGAVEVLTGLMALYSDFPMLAPEERQVMQQAWDNRQILHDIAFEIFPDSQIVLDTEQQIQRTSRLLNLTGKSGFVNTKKLITKLVQLHGMDPNEYVVDPQPHPMKPASVSFGFRGKEDLSSPIVVAILNKNQQFPTPEEIAAAQQMLLTLQSGQIVQPKPKGGPPGAPGPHPMPPKPGLPPPNQDHAPQWGLANKVAKRSRDIGGGGR